MSLQRLDGGHSVDLGLMIKPYRVLIEKAVNSRELPEQDVEFSALYTWSLLQGSVNVLRSAELSNIFDEARTKDYIEYITEVIVSSLRSMPTS